MRKDQRLRWVKIPVALAAVGILAACTPQQLTGWMPGEPGTSDVGDRISTFWFNSWIILIIIGLIVWSLLIWAAVVYRRRKGERGLPEQMRYHMPIETFFTVVPMILVAGFFAFTAREEAIIETNYAAPGDSAAIAAGAQPMDVHIEVYGKQWAWDFNYLEVEGSQYDGGVYYQGIQAQPQRDANGQPTGDIDREQLPVLYVPVNARVTFDLKARDVVHSFWVVDFHYKEDTIPGQTNVFSITPTREGSYMGKCAELCGEYHSMMLFELRVVSAEEYNQYIQSLRDQGNVGQLGDEYNRNQNLAGTSVPAREEEHDK